MHHLVPHHCTRPRPSFRSLRHRARGVLIALSSLLLAWGAPAQTQTSSGPVAVRPAGSASWSGPRTWVVDDDGGPGVHFTDVQPAVDVAADGDLIRIRPGSYSKVRTSQALAFLGPTGSSSPAVVDGLELEGVTGVTLAAGLSVRGIELRDCPGTIVLDGVTGWANGILFPNGLFATSCADVRLIDCDLSGHGFGALLELDSRVEVVSSRLLGDEGYTPDCGEGEPWGDDGGSGLRVVQSRVHLVDSDCLGGGGGDGIASALLNCWVPATGGTGGNGGGLSTADVVASATVFRGGDGGEAQGPAGSTCGKGGNGLAGLGSVRHSGCTFAAGSAGIGAGSCAPGKNKPYSPKTGALPLADPYLVRSGPPANGQVALSLRSEPGAFSRLFVGTQPVVQPSGSTVIEKLVTTEQTISLGNVPGTGVVDVNLALDPSWTSGTVVFVQAMSVFPGGEIRRTNSVPVPIR